MNAHHDNKLRPGAVGVAGIVFFVVATVSPLSATVAGLPLAVGFGNGVGTPGAFLIAGVCLAVFTVGYAAMSTRINSAGGFYAFIREGLGERLGRGAGYLALVSYNALQVAIWGSFGFFANLTVEEFLGVDIHWLIWVVVGLVAVQVLGYFDIQLSAKVLGVLMIAEVLIVLVLDAVIIGQGGEEGLTMEPFAPDAVFSGAPAFSIMIAFACYLGFEATAIYSEEAREPARTIPRATYWAVGLITVFYVLTSWSLIVAHGAGDASGAAAADPGGFVLGITDTYLGGAGTTAIKVLFLTSAFATLLGLHNAIARYSYSLGRDGWLPAAVARTHPVHRSPFVGGMVQTVTALVVMVLFALAGSDPYAHMYAWLLALATLGLIALMVLASLAVVGYFLKRSGQVGLWRGRVAPLAAAIALGVEVVLLLDNWDLQTGTENAVVHWLWIVLPLVLGIGAVLGGGRAPGVRRDPAGPEATEDAARETASP
jgi:amino acid transporter